VDEFGANILEFNHNHLFIDSPARGTSFRVTIETRDQTHADQIQQALHHDGYQIERL
jgi:threonine dehydratase